MRLLYNILFTVFFWLSAPYYFLKMWRRGHWVKGFSQRFGRYNAKLKQAITNRHVIWIHAVSVGEVNISTQLIRALEPRVPNLKIVVSTTTSTGMERLLHNLPSHIQKIYYPIDRRKYVQRALHTIRPQAIILVEAEIWPNFLWRSFDRGVPVILVNARLSEKSYRGYRRFSWLFRNLFEGFTGVGCQNESDAQRLRDLGCQPQAIQVVGNMKFDAAKVEERRVLDVPRLLRQLGVSESARLLVAGSTHSGEEALLADVFLQLKDRFPELFLVVVPRHFERGKEAGSNLAARGIRFVYRSEITPALRLGPGEIECLLVNTTGELRFFYQEATAVFIGKSLLAHGGQNPIEPGAMGKAIVFGPHMENFSAIAKTLVDRGGAVQVRKASELAEAFAELLSHPERLRQLGENALAVVNENLGAIERTVDMIIQHLDTNEIYVAPRQRK